jgi:hypothetical protein
MYCRQERVEPFISLFLALALQRRQVYRVAGALARWREWVPIGPNWYCTAGVLIGA